MRAGRHQRLGREPITSRGGSALELFPSSARGVIMSLVVIAVFLRSGGLCKPNPDRYRDGPRYGQVAHRRILDGRCGRPLNIATTRSLNSYTTPGDTT